MIDLMLRYLGHYLGHLTSQIEIFLLIIFISFLITYKAYTNKYFFKRKYFFILILISILLSIMKIPTWFNIIDYYQNMELALPYTYMEYFSLQAIIIFPFIFFTTVLLYFSLSVKKKLSLIISKRLSAPKKNFFKNKFFFKFYIILQTLMVIILFFYDIQLRNWDTIDILQNFGKSRHFVGNSLFITVLILPIFISKSLDYLLSKDKELK